MKGTWGSLLCPPLLKKYYEKKTFFFTSSLLRALGALFFAVIGLFMTAVAVAVLHRFWETPVIALIKYILFSLFLAKKTYIPHTLFRW